MIKRYFSTKDNTITNALKSDLTTRGTGSNMGESDILETFQIYAQVSSSVNGNSVELSRILIQFPVESISADRTAGTVPNSGSVKFYLKLFNAKHGQTVPKGLKLVVAPITTEWSEGEGLDMEGYTDSGYSNWIKSQDGVNWTSQGGDYSSSPRFEQVFDKGTEDLELEVTSLVEEWIAGTKTNYGFGIFLTSSQENDSTRSYYTKRFFARGTEFFFKQPYIEARFNDRKKDDRGNFFYSSSLATPAENLNTIYLYNNFRGSLRNIPSVGTGPIYVSVFSGSVSPTGSALKLVADGTSVLSTLDTVVTGGWVSTGVYTASFAITASAIPLETIYDVWHNGNLTTQYFTSSINPIIAHASNNSEQERYLIKIKNLKDKYFTDETGLFRVYARPRNWYPNIYTVAQEEPETHIIPSSSYSIYRVVDNLKIIPHGTSSTLHTLTSYDVSGNYFKLDMNLFEAGYSYGIELSIYNESTLRWDIQPETFKFRVEKREIE